MLHVMSTVLEYRLTQLCVYNVVSTSMLHVMSAALEYRLTQLCVYNVVSTSMLHVMSAALEYRLTQLCIQCSKYLHATCDVSSLGVQANTAVYTM